MDTSDRSREGDLVRRAREGDAAAFERLYRDHVDRVHGLCLRMLRDPAEAEELTQETFVKAWERLGTFRGRSAFGSWLHRLAVNRVLDHLRALGRWRERFVAADEPSSLAERTPRSRPGPRLDLEQAIAHLPERARLVFLLHDVEGWKHREIAAATGLAVGTSKAHLHRARRALREKLTP